jgi:hypothetical protein
VVVRAGAEFPTSPSRVDPDTHPEGPGSPKRESGEETDALR